jgi:hypothetical protein
MRFAVILAACVLGLCAAQTINAQDVPVPAIVQADATWQYGTYHKDYPEFCNTCYGGGGCKNCPNGDCDGCNGDSLKGVGACACHAPGIDTCRKCGLFGRIFFYECRRLQPGQEGGNGCHGVFMNDCASCCEGSSKKHKGPLAELKSRPLGGYAALSGPYQSRFGCSGFREGPMSYYGWSCGCYESYISSNLDDRGPLNSGYAGQLVTRQYGAPVMITPAPAR